MVGRRGLKVGEGVRRDGIGGNNSRTPAGGG
jgi:hypothetical protein